MAEHAADLGEGIVVELHLYHAFDPPAMWQTSCPMCSTGSEGMRSFLCKACNDDAGVISLYRSLGLRVTIGEWALGTCDMFGGHPSTLTDPDFLYAFFAASKSTFVSLGVESDYFWSGVFRDQGYDPTRYDATLPGATAAATRESIAKEYEAACRGQEWRTDNIWSADALVPVGWDYLINWHLGGLLRARTAGGHPVALPAVLGSGGYPPINPNDPAAATGAKSAAVPQNGEVVASMLVGGSCQMWPPLAATWTMAEAIRGGCHTCASASPPPPLPPPLPPAVPSPPLPPLQPTLYIWATHERAGVAAVLCSALGLCLAMAYVCRRLCNPRHRQEEEAESGEAILYERHGL